MSAIDGDIRITELGTKVDQVVLNIDYQIIEHFSRHLYGSSNKAVEELVANGFDAYAERVFVYLPGAFTTGYVAVWDDGWSMDIEGLKKLWKIAASPKEMMGRVADGPRGPRKMIGKFGIGKLASYAIGNTITHLCRVGDDFLSVSVDYRKFGPGESRPTSEQLWEEPIRRLTTDQAMALLKKVFNTDRIPEVLRSFEQEKWTLAIIGNLKGKEIQRGRLAWILGNGMPLRPDFHVWINDEAVEVKLEKEALEEWDMSRPDLISALETTWSKAVDKGNVSGTVEAGWEIGLDPSALKEKVSYILLPNLGWVWGSVRLFGRSLLDSRATEQGRSHGFFIMVRGRLLNSDDAELFLRPPSFGTFYRSQFILNIDDLDEDLLADRDRLRLDSVRSSELAVLQQALYIAARTFLEKRDSELAENEKTLAALPTRSREYYREPLMALLTQDSISESTAFNIARPRVERKVLGEDEPMAVISPSGEGFLVNTSHPYYKVLERRIGTTKKAQELYRTYEIFAVAELLLEGHLYDVGLSKEQVSGVIRWRHGLFRELAKSYEKAPSDLAIDLLNASYVGGKSFENALAAVLESMGFLARRRGEPGKEDVFIHATIGPDAYSFIFEAKGSKWPLANDKAEVSGAASHREKVGAEWAVIVAREFAGFAGRGSSEPAVLSECRATGQVSIMTVDDLVELSSVVAEFSYPLGLLKDVLMTVESPAEKRARIESLKFPANDFDYRRLLETVWEQQRENADGDYVAYRWIWQTGWKNQIAFPEFESKIVALETLAGGRIRVSTDKQFMYMLQAPEIILEAVEYALQGRGSVHKGAEKDVR